MTDKELIEKLQKENDELNQKIIDLEKAHDAIHKAQIAATFEVYGKKNVPTIIQCPKCKWIHDNRTYWKCDPGCGHGPFDTFEFLGKCPNCAKQWEDTRCPHCHQWSPHRSWYN